MPRAGAPASPACCAADLPAALPGVRLPEHRLLSLRRRACVSVLEPAYLQGLQAEQGAQAGRQSCIDQPSEQGQLHAVPGQRLQGPRAQALRLAQVQLCQLREGIPPALQAARSAGPPSAHGR